ncbi:Rmf/CrpP fold protein [Kitasatospora cineracea]|uniref:Rmf/CrpP fold protein n=1 Tax=Kitasatospora cineracea TaxID=88074 RepID=UPI0037FBF491
MGFRADIVRAVAAGIEAARDGRPATACPYPRGSLLRSAWVRGYARARPADATAADG